MDGPGRDGGSGAEGSGRLQGALERAVGLGVITDRQASAILAVDAGQTPGRLVLQGVPRVRAAVAEVLGYVGAALASVSAVIVVSQFWADIRPGARVALLGVVALALLVAGLPLHHGDRAAATRLGSFLWAVSAGALAFCAYLAGAYLLDLGEQEAVLLAAWSTAAYGGVLWWRRPLTLQQTATFVALTVGVIAGLYRIEESVGSWAGLAVWALGLAWLLLAWGGLVRPASVGWVLGSLAVLWGPLILGGAEGRWGFLLGLATAAGLVTASVALRRTPLLVLGVGGLFVFIPASVFAFFSQELGAPIALLVTGVLLVALALLLARLRPGGEAVAADGDRR